MKKQNVIRKKDELIKKFKKIMEKRGYEIKGNPCFDITHEECVESKCDCNCLE